MNQPAQQGHRYVINNLCGAVYVIAMESGKTIRVRPIMETEHWGIDLGPAFTISANMLEPLPMRYFHGT